RSRYPPPRRRCRPRWRARLPSRGGRGGAPGRTGPSPGPGRHGAPCPAPRGRERVPVSLRAPVTGEPGLRLEFRAGDGKLIRHEHRTSTQLAWWDEGLPAGVGWGENGTITLLTRFRADVTGQHLIGVAGVGRLTLTVDGVIVADT